MVGLGLGTRIGVGLALGLLLAARSEAAPRTNDACLRCHGMATFARRAATGEVISLSVDAGHFVQSEHRRLDCTFCHKGGYTAFPHPAAHQTPACPTCHGTRGPKRARGLFADIQAEFAKSIHAQRHPHTFNCFACHDPHSFERWKDASRQSIAQQNGVCLSCHASAARFAQVSAGRPLPDLAQAHAWLPHQELHREHVRCLDCHSSYQPPVKSHLILPAKQAVRDCVACHSANSVLMAKLYRHRRGEETARLGFLNAAIVNDAYVIGATRNRWVDLGVLAMLGMVLLGIGAHGLLRLRAGRSRPHLTLEEGDR